MTPDDGLFIELTQEDFEAMSPQRQAWAMFGVLRHLAVRLDGLDSNGCSRYKSETRKMTIASAMWGLLGGFLAALGKGKFW